MLDEQAARLFDLIRARHAIDQLLEEVAQLRRPQQRVRGGDIMVERVLLALA